MPDLASPETSCIFAWSRTRTRQFFCRIVGVSAEMLGAENDASFRLPNELQQGVDDGDVWKFAVDLFNGYIQPVGLSIKDIKCSLHREYLVLRVLRLAHACNVNSSDNVEFAGPHERREVLGHDCF